MSAFDPKRTFPTARCVLLLYVWQAGSGAQVDEVSSLEELRAKAEECTGRYDVWLVDYYMPGMTSKALADLVADFPAIPMAVISGSARNADVRAAIQAGIRAYIPKTSSSEYFANALQILLSGGSCIPGDIAC